MQSLWCHYGNGGNGKSTFLGSIAKMLGDYVASAPADFLMMKQGHSHPTELALMYGKRLVLAIECEGGSAESLESKNQSQNHDRGHGT